MKTLAQLVADLEADRDALLQRALDAETKNHEIARTMYRRGYMTGRESMRHGRPAVTNPERHARGKTKAMCGV